MLVVVLVLENPDRFAIRLTEQISSIGLFAVTESQCTEKRRRRGRFQISEFGFSGLLRDTGHRRRRRSSQGSRRRGWYFRN